jgi:hypothetical protein
MNQHYYSRRDKVGLGGGGLPEMGKQSEALKNHVCHHATAQSIDVIGRNQVRKPPVCDESQSMLAGSFGRKCVRHMSVAKE